MLGPGLNCFRVYELYISQHSSILLSLFAIAHAQHFLYFLHTNEQINKSNDDNVEICRIMFWLSSYCFGEIFVSRYDGVTGVFVAVIVAVDTVCPETRLNIIRKWAKAGSL